MTTTPKEDDCASCGHPFNPHLVIPTQEDVLKGGIILCNVKSCLCFSTWAINGDKQKDVLLPSSEQIQELREELQSG